MQWYLKVLRQYADFTGRARRTEFWMFILFSVLISLVLALVDWALGLQILPGATTGVLGALYGAAVLIPTLAVTVRRLHDTGRSGFWIFIGLVPVVGGIVLLVFEAMEGQRGDNAYGPDPKVAVAV